MALIKCPECNHEISDTATTCPNCGYPIKRKQHVDTFKNSTQSFTQKYKKQIVVAIIILLLLVCGIIALIVKNNALTEEEQKAVDIIQEQFDDMSNSKKEEVEIHEVFYNHYSDPSEEEKAFGDIYYYVLIDPRYSLEETVTLGYSTLDKDWFIVEPEEGASDGYEDTLKRLPYITYKFMESYDGESNSDIQPLDAEKIQKHLFK